MATTVLESIVNKIHSVPDHSRARDRVLKQYLAWTYPLPRNLIPLFPLRYLLFEVNKYLARPIGIFAGVSTVVYQIGQLTRMAKFFLN